MAQGLPAETLKPAHETLGGQDNMLFDTSDSTLAESCDGVNPAEGAGEGESRMPRRQERTRASLMYYLNLIANSDLPLERIPPILELVRENHEHQKAMQAMENERERVLKEMLYSQQRWMKENDNRLAIREMEDKREREKETHQLKLFEAQAKVNAGIQ